MSLDISKLQNVRIRGQKTTARCPACVESGDDNKGEHLVIYPDGRFACVLYPADSADARKHRKRIFSLCGDREIKPLVVRPVDLGRLGRVGEGHLARSLVKTGLLRRLGRVFETHVKPEPVSGQREKRNAGRELNDFGTSVLGVLSDPTVTPHRPLSEIERVLLVRWCGTDTDPIIFEAINLFNGRIVGIDGDEESRG